MLLQVRARGLGAGGGRGRAWLRHLGLGGDVVAVAGQQQAPLPLTAQPQRRGLSSMLLPAKQQARAAARARGVGLRGPQRRSMFIQTEATPNPESLKYLPGQVVLEEKYGTGMVRFFCLWVVAWGWLGMGIGRACLSRTHAHTR